MISDLEFHGLLRLHASSDLLHNASTDLAHTESTRIQACVYACVLAYAYVCTPVKIDESSHCNEAGRVHQSSHHFAVSPRRTLLWPAAMKCVAVSMFLVEVRDHSPFIFWAPPTLFVLIDFRSYFLHDKICVPSDKFLKPFQVVD